MSLLSGKVRGPNHVQLGETYCRAPRHQWANRSTTQSTTLFSHTRSFTPLPSRNRPQRIQDHRHSQKPADSRYPREPSYKTQATLTQQTTRYREPHYCITHPPITPQLHLTPITLPSPPPSSPFPIPLLSFPHYIFTHITRQFLLTPFYTCTFPYTSSVFHSPLTRFMNTSTEPLTYNHHCL